MEIGQEFTNHVTRHYRVTALSPRNFIHNPTVTRPPRLGDLFFSLGGGARVLEAMNDWDDGMVHNIIQVEDEES